MTLITNNPLPPATRERAFSRVALVAVVLLAGLAVFALVAYRKLSTVISPAPVVAQGTRIDAVETNTVAAATNTRATKSLPALTPDGYLEIGFDRLSAFPPRWSPVTTNPVTLAWTPKLVNPVPPEIKALEGKEVAVRGFMLPIRTEDGLTTEFTIMKNQQFCCYGKPLELNEWAHVRMKAGKGVKSLMDQPVVVYGTLHIGEYLQSQMVGFYQIDGDKLELPPAAK